MELAHRYQCLRPLARADRGGTEWHYRAAGSSLARSIQSTTLAHTLAAAARSGSGFALLYGCWYERMRNGSQTLVPRHAAHSPFVLDVDPTGVGTEPNRTYFSDHVH